MATKEVRETLALARACGLRIENGSKHYKCYTQDGKLAVVVPYTDGGSGNRQKLNAHAAIRRSAEK